MRIPVPIAWILVLGSFFTAGLLRQFHDRTPHTPYVPPVVGSLLFACIVVLVLVTVREHRRGAVPGPGVRLGSITPLLLMLFVEKWVSLALYNPVFYWLAPSAAEDAWLDAQFRLFAGAGLLAVCFAVARLSVPSARKTWRRARPSRFLPAVVAVAPVIVGCYAILGALALARGAEFRLAWPAVSPLLGWTLGGQALIAFAEEVYYRGLLLSEVERLAPRLGMRSAPGRRWLALSTTAGLFGLEHLALSTSLDAVVRQCVFTVALGVLFGLLVLLSANLHVAGGIHAWINWLLLGAAPHFVDAGGRPALPSGIYIGVTLVLVFGVVYVMHRRRPGSHARGRP